MNRTISRLLSVLVLVFLFGCNCSLHGQEVLQITNAESQQFDANYEEPFNIEGIGHYTSYTDDRVKVYHMDTKEKIYETSFDLCELAIVDWFINGQNIIYISYQSILFEHILTGAKEEYFFGDPQEDFVNPNLRATQFLGIIRIDDFQEPKTLQFDIKNRRFLDEVMSNHVFTTPEYFYHTTGFFGDSHFIKFHRSTYESDTLLSNYTPQGNVRSEEKHYLLTVEFPVMVIDQNDELKTYNFAHGTISNGIETSTGSLILAEHFSGGTIIYEFDIANSILVRKDTILSLLRINLIDTHHDRLYVKYSSQYINFYGYMDRPYTDVKVMTQKLKSFTSEYLLEYEDILVIEHNDGAYLREILLVDKITGNILKHPFETSALYLDDEIEILSTEEGLRFIVSEEAGRSIYEYDSSTKDISFITTIDNKKGLGSSIQKNGDSYLIINEHSLQSGFEYIHPITKELKFHQVEGVICGDVIPFEGKYFYLSNRNFSGQNENYQLDFIRFDPENEEMVFLEEDYFVPKSNFYTNIASGYLRFGFVSINYTPLIFDLRKLIKISEDQEIVDLIGGIYFESEDYFYTSTGVSINKKHYRVDKSDYNNQELIYELSYRRILPYAENSFVAIFPNEAYYVEDDKVTTIIAPENFNSNYTGISDTKLILRGFTATSTIVKLYDLNSDEEFEAEVEGFAFDFVGDYIISVNSFEAPFEFISTHNETGDTYFKTSNDPYSRVYKTDTTIYTLNKELDKIQIINPKWETLSAFDANLLANASVRLVSPPNTLPIVYKTQTSISENINRNIRDYNLWILDPRTNTTSNYFECESDLRFSNAFDLGPTSTMLLRTEDEGYQIHEVSLPEYGPVAIDDPIANFESFRISPNPTQGIVTIDKAYELAYLINSVGQQLEVFQNKPVINLERYPNGIYFLNILLNSDQNYTSKIIKQ